MNCFECGATEDIQQHHVVPKSRGGTKTVPLCYSCHQKAHGRSGKGLNHGKLTREGQARAKARGVKLGNPRWEKSIDKAATAAQIANREKGEKTYRRVVPMIVEATNVGCSTLTEISNFLNNNECLAPRGGPWSRPQIHRFVKRAKKEKLIP